MRYRFFYCLAVCWFGIFGLGAAAQEPGNENKDQPAAIESSNETSIDETASDEMAVRAAIQAYVDAFNSGDADKLVSLWSPNGVYTSRTTGDATVGREAMTGIAQGDVCESGDRSENCRGYQLDRFCFAQRCAGAWNGDHHPARRRD